MRVDEQVAAATFHRCELRAVDECCRCESRLQQRTLSSRCRGRIPKEATRCQNHFDRLLARCQSNVTMNLLDGPRALQGIRSRHRIAPQTMQLRPVGGSWKGSALRRLDDGIHIVAVKVDVR